MPPQRQEAAWTHAISNSMDNRVGQRTRGRNQRGCCIIVQVRVNKGLTQWKPKQEAKGMHWREMDSWIYMPIIWALGRQRQEYLKVRISFCYIMSSRLAWATWEPASKGEGVCFIVQSQWDRSSYQSMKEKGWGHNLHIIRPHWRKRKEKRKMKATTRYSHPLVSFQPWQYWV